MSKAKKKREQKADAASQQFTAGYRLVRLHPLFSCLDNGAFVLRDGSYKYQENGLAAVTMDGCILCNSRRRANPEEWARAIAHCLLHLAFGHFVAHDNPVKWNMACDCMVEKFLTDLKFGKPWYDRIPPSEFHDEEKLYCRLCETVDEDLIEYGEFGTVGKNAVDMIFKEHREWYNKYNSRQWSELFAKGLSRAVADAVRAVSESRNTSVDSSSNSIHVETARKWFIARYPLLGAIAGREHYLFGLS